MLGKEFESIKFNRHENFYRTDFRVDPKYIEGAFVAGPSKPHRKAVRIKKQEKDVVEFAAEEKVESDGKLDKHHRTKKAPYGSIYHLRPVTPGPGYYKTPRGTPREATVLFTGSAREPRSIIDGIGPGAYDPPKFSETKQGRWSARTNTGRPDCENGFLPVHCASLTSSRIAIASQISLPVTVGSVLDGRHDKSDFEEGAQGKSWGFEHDAPHHLLDFLVKKDLGPVNRGQGTVFISKRGAQQIIKETLRDQRTTKALDKRAHNKPSGFTFSRSDRM